MPSVFSHRVGFCQHLFKAHLPGVKKEGVEEGERVLQISGERRKEEEKRDKWHLVERRGGKFLRRFPLPGECCEGGPGEGLHGQRRTQ
ncbi:hypothetical protein B296_00033701 [Ensete ventricosum]|uniref:SHSP domain-containing protein n=1 Tax=Ensete ventricosum TaxID=4639 RepID=A0A427AA69_ENSVE|nr:hypothetical protein B296_00033701 [Ensete ventricosum]